MPPVSRVAPLTALVALALLCSAVVLARPAASQATVTRLDAGTPVEAGVAASRAVFSDDEAAHHVIVVRDDVFADALVAGPLAGELPGLAPILFTGGDALDPATAAEITRVTGGEGTAHLIGGTAALSRAVEDAVVDLGLTVQRVGGATRLDTSELVFRTYFAGDVLSGAARGGDLIVTRAYGTGAEERDGWPDSITAGGYGALSGTPVVLVGDEGPTASLAEELAEAYQAAEPADDGETGADGTGQETDEPNIANPAGAEGPPSVANETVTALVVGGTDAVSTDAEDALAELGFTTLRIAGPNREDTAVAVARELYGAEPLTADDTAILVNGRESFAYGLAASTIAAAGGEGGGFAPILLVGVEHPVEGDCADGDVTEAATACYLDAAEPGPVLILGDERLVSDAVAAAAER